MPSKYRFLDLEFERRSSQAAKVTVKHKKCTFLMLIRFTNIYPYTCKRSHSMKLVPIMQNDDFRTLGVAIVTPSIIPKPPSKSP